MNLIEDSFEEKKKDNTKKIAKIILIVMVILIIAIIALFGTMMYIKDNTLKLYIDGVQNDKVKDMMMVDTDGTVYFPIKEIASYLGYKSYNGEYTDKSEDASKCYVQNEDEIANFTLNSKTIYKLNTDVSNSNYEYYYMDKPVKAVNGVLYATSQGIQDAFNISFANNTETKRVYIYTMPYLIQSYSAKVLDYGYTEISDEFVNQKTVLNSMLVVAKDKKSYGVIDLKGNTIIEPKYDSIQYLPNSGDFMVGSNGKVGIISAKKETKVEILYDSLELIDSDAGLYLAKRDNKYGVIDSKGKIKIYIEYDEVGIDSSKFSKNEIKSKYLLVDNLIPVRKDKLWALFDIKGNKVVDFEYDSFGYIATSNKDAMNLLVIPDYNVIVACKNKKYLLINSSGVELCKAVLDDVYMTISSGQKYYYMNWSDHSEVNVLDFLDSQSVKPISNKTTNISQNETSNEVTENVTETNNTNNTNNSNNSNE